jgi:hypothetical protein
MKLAIMQPYFFPYIGYYQAISAVDKYILYDNLAYIKRGWVNKNRLLVVNREPVYIIVPVKDKSCLRKINEIELVDNKNWRKKILNTIFMNYKKTSYFDEIYSIVEHVINSEVRLLTELNIKSIIDISRYLDIKTEITTDTSKYFHLEEKLEDDRLDIAARFPSVKLLNPEKKVIRVIEICRTEGADVFINAIGGQELYDKEEFTLNDIKLFFVQTKGYSYKQSTEIFYPHLSIIDVLMNCGKAGTKELLNKYDLI